MYEGRPRVLLLDPFLNLETAREILGSAGVAVQRAHNVAGGGSDVVGIATGPDYPVVSGDFERLPGLRVVSTCSVGFDHIDVDAARRHGVWVSNVPDAYTEEMADSTLALLLALVRGIVRLDRSVQAGEWNWRAAGPLRRIAGTRLAIVGFGRIGRAVASRCLRLGFEVWVSDPFVQDSEIRAAGAHSAALEELLPLCTAFSLHAPLEPGTEALIGAAEIALMPRGSVLVNTARALLVDAAALVHALEDGHLAGAALDVLPIEPPTASAPPPQAPGLIVTPHAAWYSPEAEEAVGQRPLLSIRQVLEGQRPDGAVVDGTASPSLEGR